jgi:hypothetical protein
MRKFFKKITQVINTFNSDINAEVFDATNSATERAEATSLNDPLPSPNRVPASGLTHADLADEISRYRANAEIFHNALKPKHHEDK